MKKLKAICLFFEIYRIHRRNASIHPVYEVRAYVRV